MKNVVIIIRCMEWESLYGNLLIFRTLRVGFPTSRITVIDNGSLIEMKSRIPKDVDYFKVGEIPHHALLAHIICAAKTDTVILDPDIIFWGNCEDWTFPGILTGRFIPEFKDDVYSNCITKMRIHTSFMIFKVGLWDTLVEIGAKYPEFEPFKPLMIMEDDHWYRYDTMATLLPVLDCNFFVEKELDSYDHIFCGTDIKIRKQVKYEELQRIHELAKQDDLTPLRGIYKIQDKFFYSKGATW